MWDGVLRGMDAVEHNMHEKERKDHEGKLHDLCALFHAYYVQQRPFLLILHPT